MAFIAVIALAVALSYFVDEPLRRHIEGQMNERLTGYSVSIGGLSFHPIGLSLTLYDVVFVQDAHPDPPIGHLARLDASVQWKALLRAKLVANFALSDPRLYINMQHLQAEAADPEPVTRKGWQEAFEAIYPLKINEFKITGGQVTYVAPGCFAPLHVSHANFTAGNIRNVRDRDDVYPSPVHLDAVVFATGRVAVDGPTNFLSLRTRGQVTIGLEGIDLVGPSAAWVEKFSMVRYGERRYRRHGDIPARQSRPEPGPQRPHREHRHAEHERYPARIRKVRRSAGTFSVYSEVRVKDRRIEGYVKPLFSGLDVYHPDQDREKQAAPVAASPCAWRRPQPRGKANGVGQALRAWRSSERPDPIPRSVWSCPSSFTSLLYTPMMSRVGTHCAIKFPHFPRPTIWLSSDTPMAPTATARNALDGIPAVYRSMDFVTSSSVWLGGLPT